MYNFCQTCLLKCMASTLISALVFIRTRSPCLGLRQLSFALALRITGEQLLPSSSIFIFWSQTHVDNSVVKFNICTETASHLAVRLITRCRGYTGQKLLCKTQRAKSNAIFTMTWCASWQAENKLGNDTRILRQLPPHYCLCPYLCPPCIFFDDGTSVSRCTGTYFPFRIRQNVSSVHRPRDPQVSPQVISILWNGFNNYKLQIWIMCTTAYMSTTSSQQCKRSKWVNKYFRMWWRHQAARTSHSLLKNSAIYPEVAKCEAKERDASSDLLQWHTKNQVLLCCPLKFLNWTVDASQDLSGCEKEIPNNKQGPCEAQRQASSKPRPRGHQFIEKRVHGLEPRKWKYNDFVDNNVRVRVGCHSILQCDCPLIQEFTLLQLGGEICRWTG